MRGVRPAIFVVKRSVRRKATAENHGNGILEEGATFSDVHSVIYNPATKLPYPEEHLREHLEKTSKQIFDEKKKAKYSRGRQSGRIEFDHVPLDQQLVMLFPGQGAQFIGMGTKTADVPAAKKIFEQASEVLGYDVEKLCREGPKTKLDQTLYCQPAVFVSSIAALEAFRVKEPDCVEKTSHVAGFSVGEFSALVAAGVLSFEDALKVVRTRCEAMHECNQLIRSGMMTVRVNARSRLQDAMEHARQIAKENGELEVCEVANYLYCGVRVIGASETCMLFLEERQKEYEFQVVKRLAVSGAFHTRQMEDAVPKVREALKGVELRQPTCNVYSNFTGHIYSHRKGEIRSSIAKQVTSPVKWEQIQQVLYRLHKDHTFPRYLEIGPGRQLGAMLLQTSKKAYACYEHISC